MQKRQGEIILNDAVETRPISGTEGFYGLPANYRARKLVALLRLMPRFGGRTYLRIARRQRELVSD